jgi:serine/threonine protein kinase
MLMVTQEHILKFVDWDEKAGVPQDTLLITELFVGGTLQQSIDNTSKGLAGHEVLELLAQISSALEYLHSRGSFHSDVKPRNTLVRKLQPIHIVLGDCGDIKQVERIPKGPPRGTPAYLSPEILLHNRCQGTGDDMWALGITMLGLVGQWPQMVFTKDGAKEYPKKCFDHVLLLKRLNPGHELVEDLLAKLVHWNAASRMKAKECRRRAAELRDSGKWGDETVYLKMPEDFKPVSFW